MRDVTATGILAIFLNQPEDGVTADGFRIRQSACKKV